MNQNSKFITIEDVSTKKLAQKLNLTGYVFCNLSILINQIYAKLPQWALNTKGEKFPEYLNKDFVENTLSSPIIDFLLKNNYLSESEDNPYTFIITEKSQNIFKMILESEIKL